MREGVARGLYCKFRSYFLVLFFLKNSIKKEYASYIFCCSCTNFAPTSIYNRYIIRIVNKFL